MVHIIQACLSGFQGPPSSALSLVSMFLFFGTDNMLQNKVKSKTNHCLAVFLVDK